MRISYVRIENFRNFKLCEVNLGHNMMLIGENKAGKSNFIAALRLVLDPSLSDSNRQLTAQDFWDGDGKQPFDGRSIKVAVQFTDFADEEPEYIPLTWLSACLIATKPRKVAQLTYIYYPDNNQPEATNDEDDYTWMIYPKDSPDERFNFRGMWKDMPMRYIDALRDMTRDNQVWQRSPLNQLVKLSGLTTSDLQSYADEITEISQKIIHDREPLSILEREIQTRLLDMIGRLHNIDPQLGLTVITPEAILRSLRIFVDGLQGRTMDRTSLGLQNIIYLALLSLELDKKQEKRGRTNKPYLPIVALEEPEAHLHPHLQRLVFQDFLERANIRRQPVIISSHSPHLASVANIDDFVLMKESGAEGCKAYSAHNFLQSLKVREHKDLSRFLDITKAEMLFAKGVIFVEGDVEVFLVHTFAEVLEISLDQYGISVCNVYGTAFQHVVTLASKLSVPFVVLTDGDKFRPVKGLQRGIDLIERIAPELSAELRVLYDSGNEQRVRDILMQNGIFVNEWTLEPTLIEAGLNGELKRTFRELGEELGINVRVGADHVDTYMEDPTDENMQRILSAINDSRWGKGRFAHRLSYHIKAKAGALEEVEEKAEFVPSYIREAINYLVDKVQTGPIRG